jgi:maltooligosyltrehalose trehalohydrolase
MNAIVAAAQPHTPGLTRRGDGAWRMEVWAPRCDALSLVVEERAPQPLAACDGGWWRLDGVAVVDGSHYRLRLPDGRELPDPASCHQPEGVHGPSAAVDFAAFRWTDGEWRGRPLEQFVIYELHLGTFTDEGTCDAAIARLDALVDLGITAIEIMPVAQCPGQRNWGYDGVHPFAVQHSLGGPAGLQRLVDACHARGLAVILDVVYNHLGPEGNYLPVYMPITSDRYRIPWGESVNVDGPGSDGVRAYLSANVHHWFSRYHIDALRLDAVHAIIDISARPFLAELARQTRTWAGQLGRSLHLFAESDLNASRVVRPLEQHGYGMDSQWTDDFHHALHALLTGERHGYYSAYGQVEDLRRAFTHGYVYDGRWSASRQMTWGDDASDLPTTRFIVCGQNHDQIGNRYGGERLSQLTDFEGLKFAAACVLLSPYIPLLFMGEEWAESRPFYFFVDHGDPGLVAAVRKGRDQEFASLNGSIEPHDPFDPATRDACRLDWPAAEREPGRTLREFYRTCLRLRRDLPSLHPGPRSQISVDAAPPDIIAVQRRADGCRTLLLLNPTVQAVAAVHLPEGAWRIALASASRRWRGTHDQADPPGPTVTMPPRSALLLQDHTRPS